MDLTTNSRTNLLLMFVLAFMVVFLSGAMPAHAQSGNVDAKGQFDVSILRNGQWVSIGTLAYGKDISGQTLDVAGLMPGQVAVSVSYAGDTAAQMDAVKLSDQAPIAVQGTAEDSALALKKLASIDYDVIDAANRLLTFTFELPAGETPVLTLAARIEPETISKTPFQFPAANQFRKMSPSSSFYPYAFDSRPCRLTVNGDLNDDNLGEPFFKEFTKPTTGHPASYTYGWVCNDAQNLYAAIDFLSDDTMDGDKDYAKVYVNAPNGLHEFQVSVPEQRWGKSGFIYTARAVYQHKAYEFQIPLNEIGLTQAQPGERVELAFAAYGTAAAQVMVFSKTPHSQTITRGSTANFTITITNPNPGIDLTDAVVTDPLAPDCSRNVGTVAANTMTSYHCSRQNVTAGFTNVATLNGLIFGEVAMNPVSDSATVQVAIAPAEVPEADTLLLFGGGIGGLVTWLGWQLRKRKR